VSTAGGASLQLLQVAVLARMLGPDEFGQMAVILVLLSIGRTFAEFGLSSAIIQRPKVGKSELGTLYAFNLVVGLVLFAALWVTAPWASAILNVGDTTKLIRGAAIVFLIAPWGLQIRALLQKRLEFRVLTTISLSAGTIGTGAAIGLALNGFGVWALLGGYLVTEGATAGLLLQRAYRDHLLAGLAWNLGGVKSYLVFGGYRLAAMVANTLNAKVDQLLVGGIMGASVLGYYNIAQRLALEPVQKLNPIVTRVAFPVFSLAQDDLERLRRGYLRMSRLLLGINAPLLVGLAATAHLVVPVFLGPNWDQAVPLVRLLAVYALLRSVGNAGGALLMARGRADWSFYWNLALLLVVPAAVWTAAETTGTAIGVATALILVHACVIVVHYFALIRRLIGKCGAEYLIGILRPVLAATLMGAVVFFCDWLLIAHSRVLRMTIGVLLGCLLYCALSFAFQRELVTELGQILGIRKSSWGQAQTG
jgi:O-antigen/teichoic acid export membrane protein